MLTLNNSRFQHELLHLSDAWYEGTANKVLQINIDYLGSATILRHFLFCASNEPKAMLAWVFGECRDNLRNH